MTAVEVPSKEKVYTYDDYVKLPEGAPYQLIEGRLVVTPVPSTYHQDISMKLSKRKAIRLCHGKETGQCLSCSH
jgi:hypothetical protein